MTVEATFLVLRKAPQPSGEVRSEAGSFGWAVSNGNTHAALSDTAPPPGTAALVSWGIPFRYHTTLMTEATKCWVLSSFPGLPLSSRVKSLRPGSGRAIL